MFIFRLDLRNYVLCYFIGKTEDRPASSEAAEFVVRSSTLGEGNEQVSAVQVSCIVMFNVVFLISNGVTNSWYSR